MSEAALGLVESWGKLVAIVSECADDHRKVVGDLLAQIQRLRERIAEMEGERESRIQGERAPRAKGQHARVPAKRKRAPHHHEYQPELEIVGAEHPFDVRRRRRSGEVASTWARHPRWCVCLRCVAQAKIAAAQAGEPRQET